MNSWTMAAAMYTTHFFKMKGRVKDEYLTKKLAVPEKLAVPGHEAW